MASKAKKASRVAARQKAAAVAKNPRKASRPVAAAGRASGKVANRTVGGRNNNKSKNKAGRNISAAAASKPQSSGANSTSRVDYSFKTVPGSIYDQNLGNLIDYGNKFGDNDMVAGAVHGTVIDSLGTGVRMGQAAQYNDMYLESLGKYQGGLENLRTGNTMKLMGAEAGLARDLIGVQGKEERLTIAEQGNQDRLGFRVQGEEERKNLQEQGSQTLRLRADARGAIRSQGRRFFG